MLFFFDHCNMDVASSEINADITSICHYSVNHGLSINSSKSSVVIFCSDSKRSDIETSLIVKVNNIPIPFSDHIKCLGLFIDKKLRFHKHISALLQKSYIRLKMLYANKSLLNFKMRKKLCEALVLSVFWYSSIVYYPCLDQATCRRLSVVQNNCIRFIFRIRKYDHISDCFRTMGWLKFPILVDFYYIVFLYKLLSTGIPVYLREKLIFRHSIHDRCIRNTSKLTMPLHCTTLFSRSFTHKSVTLYNTFVCNLANMSL